METESSDSITAAVIIVGLLALLVFMTTGYFCSKSDIAALKTEVAVLSERNANQQEILRLVSKQMPPCELPRKECGSCKYFKEWRKNHD